MKIRTRLNLWYSAVLCLIAAVIISAAAYHELVIERQQHPDADADASAEATDDLLDLLTWTLTPAVVLGLVGGWWVTRRALAPVNRLAGAVEHIHEQNLGKPIPRSGNGDELDRLTEVFNHMTGRLNSSFQQIREFTLHASHELKTPLTVLHGETETALRDEHLPAPQRERLASQLDEIQRLTKIVDGLTLLTKADAGQVVLKLEPVALDEIVREIYEDAQILARPAGLAVRLSDCEGVKISGDKHRLRQLLLNLADNAVKYNQPGGTVEISLRRNGNEAEVKMANTGAGISAEQLPRVFERFFRGHPGPGPAAEGCGLGLSIARWIVTAHGGTIGLESLPGTTTTVTVKLPAC